MASPGERAFALEMARFYRRKGFNVLPSCEDAKKPMFRFAHLWETMAPDEWFTDEGFPDTCNLQCVCGAAWRLLAVDLDGAEARKVWDRWVAERGCPRTWMVHREGGDSFHLWFKSPRWWDGPIKKRVAWKEEGAKHSAIEVLGDRSLIVAPPSRHVKTGGQYRFVSPQCSPARMGHPAEAPAWVMKLPAVVPERPKVEFVAKRPSPGSRIVPGREHLDRNEVLDAVADKVGLARSWGLRTVGRPSERGWQPCHAFDRPDTSPSAAIHVQTGCYVDRGGDGRTLAYPDLMAAMGHAHDWKDALERLAQRYR